MINKEIKEKHNRCFTKKIIRIQKVGFFFILIKFTSSTISLSAKTKRKIDLFEKKMNKKFYTRKSLAFRGIIFFLF